MQEGDRIAQLILERVYTPDVLEVEVGRLAAWWSPLMQFFRTLMKPSVVLEASVLREDTTPSTPLQHSDESKFNVH